MAASFTQRLKAFWETQELDDGETFVKTHLKPRGITNLGILLSLSTSQLEEKLPEFYLLLRNFVEQLSVDEQLLKEIGMDLATLLSLSREDLVKRFPVFHQKLQIFVEQLSVGEQLLKEIGMDLATLLSLSREDLVKRSPVFHQKLQIFVEQLSVDEQLLKEIGMDLATLLSLSPEDLVKRSPVFHQKLQIFVEQLSVDEQLLKEIGMDLATLLSLSPEDLVKRFPVFHQKLQLYIKKFPIDEKFLNALDVCSRDFDTIKDNLAKENRGSVEDLISGFDNRQQIIDRVIGRPSAEKLWSFVELHKVTPKWRPVQSRSHDPQPIIAKELSTLTIPSKGAIHLEVVDLGDNPHAEKFRIARVPAVPGIPEKPLWLLYRLGNPQAKARVQRVKSRNYEAPVLLFAPSGSGKTRLAMEFLCVEYGLYLIVRDKTDENYGSTALTDISVMIENSFRSDAEVYGWYKDNPCMGIFAQPKEYDDRRTLAEFGIQCVITAYLSIFNYLGGEKALSPYEWLLIQLFPTYFLGLDYFSELAKSLYNTLSMELDVIRSITKATMPVKYYIVDEANLLSKMMPFRFQTQGIRDALPSDAREKHYSLGGIGLRSFICPVVSAIKKCTGRSPIIAGTGLSQIEAYRTSESQMAEPDNNFTRVAYFDFPQFTVDEVKGFLRELIYLNEIDLLYAARWLQGRPRFSTHFVANVVANRSVTIADELTKYIVVMTEEGDRLRSQEVQEIGDARTPHDALVQLVAPSPTVVKFGNNEKNFDLYVGAVLGIFFLQYGLTKVGMPISMPLVEIGLGIVDDSDARRANITMEPLVLQAGCKLRNEEFWEKILDQTPDLPSATGIRYEYVVGEILLPKILKGNLESNGFFGKINLPEYLKGSWEMAGSSFGMIAEPAGQDGHGFYRWMDSVVKLENWNTPNYPRGMMFPNDQCGPDVVAVLLKRDPSNKQVTSIALVFLQAKLRADDVDGKNAVLSVDPELFHHKNRGLLEKREVMKKYAADQKKFMKAIERIPVIRVLLSGGSKVRTIKPGVVKRGSMNDVLLPIDKQTIDNATAAWRSADAKAKKLKMTVN